MSLLTIPASRSSFHDRIEGAAGIRPFPIIPEDHMVNGTGSEASQPGF